MPIDVLLCYGMQKSHAATPRNAVSNLEQHFVGKAGPLFDLKRAAELAGFSEDTLSRAIAAGKLHAGRPGGNRIRISALNLAEWLLSR